MGGITIAMRLVPSIIPKPGEIDLPESLLKATHATK